MQNNLQFRDICRPKKKVRVAYNNDSDFKYNNETGKIIKSLGYNAFGEEDSGIVVFHYDIIERWLLYRYVLI